MNKNKNVVFFLLIGTFKKKKWKISHLLFFDKRHQNWRFCNNGMGWDGLGERGLTPILSLTSPFIDLTKKLDWWCLNLQIKTETTTLTTTTHSLLFLWTQKLKATHFFLSSKKKIINNNLVEKKNKKKEFPNIILY